MNAPMVFGTNSTQRMRIHPGGQVSVGTATAMGNLASVEYGDGGMAIYAAHTSQVEQNVAQYDTALYATTTVTVNAGVTNSGDGIGTRSEAYLTGTGALARTIGVKVDSGVYPNNTGTITDAVGAQISIIGGRKVTKGVALVMNNVDATLGYGVWQDGTDDLNYFASKVAIGKTVPNYPLDVVGNANISGDLNVQGNIAAKFQDVAEWVPATEDLVPGTVVILDPSTANRVMASNIAYDTTVAGVVSTQPGIILGEAGASKEQIATTGRVLVRVDATPATIRIGDLLVTSGVPGVAMKSEPLDLGGGRKLHQPGTIIGKALEPLESGRGQVMVLLSLQ